MKTHKDLDVYNLSMDLITLIYKTTKAFPKEELFGLTSQMRRSAVSIPSNIAEGSARNHKKEFNQFLYISLSSASELDTLITIALKLEYINKEVYYNIFEKLTSISKMLQGLIRSIKTYNQ